VERSRALTSVALDLASHLLEDGSCADGASLRGDKRECQSQMKKMELRTLKTNQVPPILGNVDNPVDHLFPVDDAVLLDVDMDYEGLYG
jgi:hypothetical protein